MQKYISTTEMAAKWGISKRRIALLCSEGRVEGAYKVAQTWLIPDDSIKPLDDRVKSGKYIKKKEGGGEKT